MECFSAAIEDSDKIKDCALKIEQAKAIGVYHDYENPYQVSSTHGICPSGGSESFNLLTIYKFEIIEIIAK